MVDTATSQDVAGTTAMIFSGALSLARERLYVNARGYQSPASICFETQQQLLFYSNIIHVDIQREPIRGALSLRNSRQTCPWPLKWPHRCGSVHRAWFRKCHFIPINSLKNHPVPRDAANQHVGPLSITSDLWWAVENGPSIFQHLLHFGHAPLRQA